MEAAKREYDLSRSAELKYGTLISLQQDGIDFDITEIVSKWTGISLSNLQRSVHHKRVIGQDIAVKLVADVIRVQELDCPNPIDPLQVSCLWALLVEYMEKHAVSRSVGAPPSYVGYEEGGQLTEVVRRGRYSVVLFNEIEKAHRGVINILVQLLNDGRIIESEGRTVSFTNCVLIMTSNIGSHHILETLRNTQDNKDTVYDMMKRQVIELAIQTFRLEFMNRIDEYIQKIDLHYTKEAVKLLGMLGFDPNFGARPVKCVIQHLVENEIEMGVLRGDFRKYGRALSCCAFCSSGYSYLHDI
ncbi:hypothetical protein UlMin_045095 [Ulmus minor]